MPVRFNQNACSLGNYQWITQLIKYLCSSYVISYLMWLIIASRVCTVRTVSSNTQQKLDTIVCFSHFPITQIKNRTEKIKTKTFWSQFAPLNNLLFIYVTLQYLIESAYFCSGFWILWIWLAAVFKANSNLQIKSIYAMHT